MAIARSSTGGSPSKIKVAKATAKAVAKYPNAKIKQAKWDKAVTKAQAKPTPKNQAKAISARSKSTRATESFYKDNNVRVEAKGVKRVSNANKIKTQGKSMLSSKATDRGWRKK